MNIKVHVKYMSDDTYYYCLHTLRRTHDMALTWDYADEYCVRETPFEYPILPNDERDFSSGTFYFKETDLRWAF